MWALVTYSNYFEIVSTVTFLANQTHFRVCLRLTLLLYTSIHVITIKIMIIHGTICAAPGF